MTISGMAVNEPLGVLNKTSPNPNFGMHNISAQQLMAQQLMSAKTSPGAHHNNPQQSMPLNLSQTHLTAAHMGQHSPTKNTLLTGSHVSDPATAAAANSLAAYQQLSFLNYLEENLLAAMLASASNQQDTLKIEQVSGSYQHFLSYSFLGQWQLSVSQILKNFCLKLN